MDDEWMEGEREGKTDKSMNSAMNLASVYRGPAVCQALF